MNMKSVELQIAVPRTAEAGRIQQDHLQRPANDQHMLNAQTVKKTELDRHRSQGVDETAHTEVREGEKQSSENMSHGNQRHRQNESEQQTAAEHPYKGHHLDLSL